jgi:predicted RNA polymerase sigma factor
MLSTDTRLRVEFICERISQGAPVELKDMAWLQKLAARNPTVDTWLRQARRTAMQEEDTQTDLDAFCNALDLGEPDPSDHLVGPSGSSDVSRVVYHEAEVVPWSG